MTGTNQRVGNFMEHRFAYGWQRIVTYKVARQRNSLLSIVTTSKPIPSVIQHDPPIIEAMLHQQFLCDI